MAGTAMPTPETLTLEHPVLISIQRSQLLSPRRQSRGRAVCEAPGVDFDPHPELFELELDRIGSRPARGPPARYRHAWL
jgi:hypothetical protein